VLIDRAVQVPAAAGELDVGLIHEPAIVGRATGRPCGIEELRGEGLHPTVDRHVIDLDAAFGQQLLDVSVREPVTQIPAHRHRDHLTREPITDRCGGQP
jgi:hypothetical protein